jgi:hypothetical protein
MNKTIEITTYDINYDEIVTVIPSRKEVCERCDGEGRHTNPSIDGNGITQSEMNELGPEFKDAYFNGTYDVSCHECNGLRIVRVIDWDQFKTDMPELHDEYINQLEDERNSWLENQAELRAGA